MNQMTENKMQKIDANSAEAQSADLMAANIQHLKALFPDIFTEGPSGVAIDVNVLRALVGDRAVLDSEEKFGLNWHGKRRARQMALIPSMGTLRPCPEESLEWENTKNLMIEGDNLEVLKLLQKGYGGKVKLIYIDPPYNTGRDFVYPDSFQDSIKNYLELTGQANGGQKFSSSTEASGRFHTDWLNMIFPRLKLAHSLLRNDGAIFLSIDDHEVDNLRKACNEIFGEENFVASVCWERADSPRMDADYFSTKHDYVLCYAKNIEDFKLIRTPYEGEDVPEHFNKVDETDRRYYLKPLRAMGGQGETRAARPNLYFALAAPDGERVYPKLEGGGDGAWRWSPKKVETEKSRIDWTGSKGSWTPYYRIYADESEGKPPETIWFSAEVGSTRNATAEVKALFDGVKCFDTPKPIALLERIIALTTTGGDTVLDFFGGSGTTGHAVMSQNARDGGQRRYVVVQLPEPIDGESKEQKIAADLCDKLGLPKTVAELTKERLRRAAAAIRSDFPSFEGDCGFRAFKLDSSNIRAWNPDAADLEKSLFAAEDHLVKGRTDSDVLYELLLKLGLDLCVPLSSRTVKGMEVHAVGGGVMLACLANSIPAGDLEALAQGIVAWHKELSPVGDATCVFRDAAFADDVAKTNMAAILEQNGIATVRSL